MVSLVQHLHLQLGNLYLHGAPPYDAQFTLGSLQWTIADCLARSRGMPGNEAKTEALSGKHSQQSTLACQSRLACDTPLSSMLQVYNVYARNIGLIAVLALLQGLAGIYMYCYMYAHVHATLHVPSLEATPTSMLFWCPFHPSLPHLFIPPYKFVNEILVYHMCLSLSLSLSPSFNLLVLLCPGMSLGKC